MEQSLSSSGTRIRDGQDPVNESAWYRNWSGDWVKVVNHDNHVSRTEDWYGNPTAVVWPKHIGVSDRTNYPYSIMGDNADPEGHWMKNTDPTLQGDLPVIPSAVLDTTYGMIGAMEGVFVIPSGSVLLAESTFVIGVDTYRVFTTRSHSDGNQYYAIKEV